MFPIQEALTNPETTIPIIGAASLRFGLSIFKGIKEEETRIISKLEILGDQHRGKVLELIDIEISRLTSLDNYDLREGLSNLESNRRKNVKSLIDEIWEDALVGRRFENDYRLWGKWESLGHNTCSFGFFGNVGYFLAVIFGLPNIISNVIPWLIISIFVFLIPFLFAFICFILQLFYKSRVRKVLNSPIIGAPRSRRFGDA